MKNLGLALPEKIMEALRVNVAALMDNEMSLPTYSQLNEIVKELPKNQERANGLNHPTALCVCRVDARSSTAASILSAPNFGDERGLEGGLLAFHKIH
ncbi:hypothetical protein BJ742DRAFT_773666 [Cladochytrium replicatum]|nr:hypothetical protein BJ742DRAFT_773666 [Cladochytrium replicatum]